MFGNCTHTNKWVDLRKGWLHSKGGSIYDGGGERERERGRWIVAESQLGGGREGGFVVD